MENNTHVAQDIAAKYTDIEKLFQQLPDDLRLHGIRVAEYSVALFDAAIDAEMNLADEKSVEERCPEYKDFVYKVGRYHDIGVMCLPEDHRMRQPDVTAPDLEYDVSHTLFGYALAHSYEAAAGGQPEMYWRFMREAIRMHHEKPDGNGFPDGLLMDQMSLISWIVSLGVILDEYSAYTKSETPFEDGFDKILDYSMKHDLFETEIVMKVAKNKLAKIFEQHQKETKIITYGPMMVKRTPKRPMYLDYRKVVSLSGRTIAFQAMPVFYSKSKNENLFYDEIKVKAKEAKLSQQIWEYFLYEASDMRMKMDAYGFRNYMLQVPVLTGTLSGTKVSSIFDPWIKETGTDISQYCFMVEAETMNAPSQTYISNLELIKKYGAKLMLVDFTGNQPFRAADIGVKFDIVQTSPLILDRMDDDIKDILYEIREAGTDLQADGVNTDDYDEMLESLKFSSFCGEYAGEYKIDQVILKECIDD